MKNDAATLTNSERKAYENSQKLIQIFTYLLSKHFITGDDRTLYKSFSKNSEIDEFKKLLLISTYLQTHGFLDENSSSVINFISNCKIATQKMLISLNKPHDAVIQNFLNR